MKVHPTFTNYLCNYQGDVFSLHTGRKLEPAPSPHGYLRLSIRDKGQTVRQYFHRLIWECHYGLISEGFEIDHIDGNKSNNCIKNLACLTRAEHKTKTCRDNPHVIDIFNKSKWRKVMRVSATGESTEFASVKAAAVSVMVSAYFISQAVLSGHNYCGYFWRDAEDFDFGGEYWTDVVDNNRGGTTVVFKVSNFGRFQYGNQKRKTFGRKKPEAYRLCYLGKDYGVHELICQVFEGPKPSSSHTVDHLNRDPFDNRPENLRWATKQQQARNRKTVRTVEGYVLNTGLSLGIWPTITDAAAATCTHASNISIALRGKLKSSGKTSSGYKIAWRYA